MKPQCSAGSACALLRQRCSHPRRGSTRWAATGLGTIIDHSHPKLTCGALHGALPWTATQVVEPVAVRASAEPASAVVGELKVQDSVQLGPTRHDCKSGRLRGPIVSAGKKCWPDGSWTTVLTRRAPATRPSKVFLQ
jgi:hypothetical protein